MKALCSLLAITLLSACAHQNAGIRVYEPATENRADGSSRQVSRLVASISGDMPGVKDITVGEVKLTFSEAVLGTEEEPILDKKGKLLAVRSRPIVPGFFMSGVIRAQGDANKQAVDAVASGVTGAVLSFGTAAAAGGAPGAIAGAVTP